MRRECRLCDLLYLHDLVVCGESEDNLRMRIGHFVMSKSDVDKE